MLQQKREREHKERECCWWRQQRPHVRKRGRKMRREQGGGSRARGRDAAQINSSLFLPFIPSAQFSSFILFVNDFSFHWHAVFFSEICKRHWNIHTLCSCSKMPVVCVSANLTASYTRWAGSLSRKSQTWTLTAFATSQVLTQTRGGTAGFKSRHKCIGAWPGGNKGLRLKTNGNLLCVCRLKGPINKRLLQCFVSPLFDCAKVWLEHSQCLCLAGHCSRQTWSQTQSAVFVKISST